MLNRIFVKTPYFLQIIILALHHELGFIKTLFLKRRAKYSKELLKKLRVTVSLGSVGIKKRREKGSKIVLMDFFPVPLWSVINCISSRYVSNLLEGQLRVIDFYRPSGQDRELYKALGITYFSRIKVRSCELGKLLKYYGEFFSTCKTRKQLLDYKIDNIAIGIDIYESYLRAGYPTVNIYDFRYRKWAFLAFSQLIYLERLHRDNKLGAIFSSHENYVGPGLQAKFGFRHQIPVFFANVFEINVPEHLFENHQRYLYYPLYFSNLNAKEKNKGRILAKGVLNRRISGEVGVMMPYQEKSAFSENFVERQLQQTSRKKLLIATHDFFDNPHAFEVLPFVDFLDWLDYLSSEAKMLSEYEWYLKVHRDFSIAEKTIIDRFLRNNSHIKQVDPDVSFHQLKKEGLNAVLTCYGSVGHELPFLGIPVISFSFNPHSAYHFNFPVRDISKLRDVIKEAMNFKFTPKVIKEIYEFFYVHKVMNHPNNFNVPDFKELERLHSHHDQYFEYITKFFLDIETRVVQNLKEAILSKRKYSIERELPPSKQHLNVGSQLDRLSLSIAEGRK